MRKNCYSTPECESLVIDHNEPLCTSQGLGADTENLGPITEDGDGDVSFF